MFSKALKLPGLEAFSKIELYELFISVFILMVAEGIFLFSGAVSTAYVGADPFEVARDFHSRMMLEGVFPAISYSYQMIGLFSTLNSFQIRPNDSVWTWIYKVCPGADMMVGVFNLLSYGLIIVMSSLNAHMFILAVIEGTMKDFFLPAGILLRFLPPTRKAGVFVITMAIGFYAVYPTTYALHSSILDEVAAIEEGDPTATYNPFPKDVAYGLWIGAAATPFVVGSIIGGAAGYVPTAAAQLFLGFIASEAFLMIMQPVLFSPVLDAIAGLSLVTFFLPALSMVITIAFINGVTNFIDQKVN